MTGETVKPESRITYIDALKGLAIIAVVFGHIGNGFMWYSGISPVYFWIYNITNVFHMPLFMILSGFVFHRAHQSSFSMGKVGRQIVNLTIIYFLWSLLLGISKMFFSGMVNNPVTVRDLLLIPVKPIQLYWYLFILIIFYAVFGLLIKFRIPLWITLIVTFCLNAASIFLEPNLLFDVKRVLYYSFFFALGMLLQTRFQEKKAAGEEVLPGQAVSGKTPKRLYPEWIIAGVLFAVAVVLCIVLWNSGVILHEHYLSVVMGAGISLGLYELFQSVHWFAENRFLSWIGRHSLEIYLIHTYILSALRGLFGKTGVENAALIIIISFAAGLFLPILIAAFCRLIRIYKIFFSPGKIIFKTHR